LKALLESATVAAYDGDTVQLAFPPDKKFAVTKVDAKTEELRAALQELFGVRPAITCIVRDAPGGVIEVAVEEEETPSEEEALRRIQAELGAQVSGEAE
jgi:hypothetical protein